MDIREAEMKAPLQRVWDGMIPIELQLAAADAIELLASAVLPEPFQTFYLLVPRVSYFPFITQKIKEWWLNPMFALSGGVPGHRNAEIKDADIWFEYRGQPLKWHYPVGLLYDMLVAGGARGEPELPWGLTLHVRKFPVGKLVAGSGVQSMRDMFMAMIKESDFIRNGSTKRVMDLAKSDQMQFLDGLETHKFEKYSAIHAILVPSANDVRPMTAAAKNGGGRPGPKAIPLKFYMETAGGEDSAAKDPSAQPDINMFHVSQFPVPLMSKEKEGEQTTVADAFRLCYEISDQDGDAFITSRVCLSQGIAVPWETPISWLAENLYYADCFLHLVVVSA
ncbi:autophagy protein 5 [Coemansia sp. RSA 2703]|nr:autophagy protein 5 [Coemansia sp. RSA 2703]KAJ2376693.1 autophagy protein 5 [Coemansia sp. RSA 2607]